MLWTASLDTPLGFGKTSTNLTNVEIQDSQMYSKLIQSHIVDPKQKLEKKHISYQIPVSNNYEILSDNEDEMVICDEYDVEGPTKHEEKRNSDRTKPSAMIERKPPPIIIHHKMKSSKEFVDFLKVDIKKGFEMKHTRNNTNLFINDTTEYNKYLQKIKREADENFQFHTYTLKQEKIHGFVLRGLDKDTNIPKGRI